MTPEQHNALAQLAQLGLQRLGELASSALDEIRPSPPEAPIDEA
jgi:hypothetical protein